MAFLVRIGKTQENAFSKTGTAGTDYIEIPCPSTYKTTTTTLVDSSRNSKAEVIATVVAQNVKKIEMSWKVIGIANYSQLAKFLNANFFFYVYYFDMDDNSYPTAEAKVKQFYVGDRVADALQNKQLITATVNNEQVYKVEHIQNFKISFIDTYKVK